MKSKLERITTTTSSPNQSLTVSRALTNELIKHEAPDRTYFIRKTLTGIRDYFSSSISDLYNSLVLTFSLNSIDFQSFKKYIWPIISSGAALVVGEYVTSGISRYLTGTSEYDFIYKFLFGAAFLGYSALQRITEKGINSTAALSAAVAREVVGIIYMYSSVYNGINFISTDWLSESHSSIISLISSALVVPSTISYFTRKLQERLVRYQYSKGAQRSDTAIISSGTTPIANLYFQINHIIATELMSIPRMFQLGLISDNMRNSHLILNKFKNLPALLADLAPSTIRQLLVQQEKLQGDYDYNNTLHKVIRFTSQGPKFVDIPRYELRIGDLVYCDHSIELSSVPISGELIALKKNKEGRFLKKPEVRKFSVNLKAQNGEDVWIEHQSKSTFSSKFNKVDLHAIHDGKQPGVLVGDKLNLYGGDNFFIQIKPENELMLSSDYEKKSVINQIIAERKKRSVLHSILASIIMAAFLQRDITAMPEGTISLMFTLFQTMIPFSEAFLRDVVNSQLLKKLNVNLEEKPFETIDALRVVDLCNAIGGYYHDRFPRGVAIISDKTGTLTTNNMDVLGLWTLGMAENVQNVLKDNQKLLLPENNQILVSFETFLCAFTNNPKELEPEEFAILEFYKTQLNNQDCIQIATYGNNHFKKEIKLQQGINKEVETFHLGLYRNFGGRFTLVVDGKIKKLVFCGIPKPEAFKHTALLKTYNTMRSREGVLSRDWCIASTELSDEQFYSLKALFEEDKKKQIEAYLVNHSKLLKGLTHQATFIVDNPVKKDAEKFIAQCLEIEVPVFVATGDTVKAAKNITRVLSPTHADNIIVIRADMDKKERPERIDIDKITNDSTVIFSGINPHVLDWFKKLLLRKKVNRPVIIFAEMSTEQKGVLAQFLRDNQFFVVANGDGTNDVMMMKNSNMVIAHQADDKSFAPGVGPLSNISDVQLRKLMGSDASFYQLFDIHRPNSMFKQKFAPMANSQEKPTEALAIKSSKMSFDLARAAGVSDVKDMNQQHWFSVLFDLIWLWIAYSEIKSSSDLPLDNQNISKSKLVSNSMGIAMFFALCLSTVNYVMSGESTNLISMFMMLLLLPILLKSIFSGFRNVQDRLFPKPEVIKEEKQKEKPRGSILGYLGSFFKRDNKPDNKDLTLDDTLKLKYS